MVADVSSMVRVMKGVDSNEKPTAPITRDLLGGCCTHDSKELDLDLQVPTGWEKRLDLKSGKVYLQRCNSPHSSTSTSDNKKENINTCAKFEDLNFTPVSNKQTLNLFTDSDLDLKLVSSPSAMSPSTLNYQSACTLDKVKFALERAEKETIKKRSISSMSNSSSQPSNSSSSIEQEEKSPTSFVAAGCPCCFLYVLISKTNPKCPRCNSEIALPVVAKKARIDLNISI